ncbi:hypothetical protein UIS43_27910 (plasmid) [Nocardiopsis sp. LDBS0036]|uniref:hypothetical protein n=1 Tax=Nocardiopsis sp. LDBS0036 TaxID=3104276 RepID=UPI00351690E7
MTDLNPDEEHFYATSSTTVLNDLLADTATRLGGKLVALSRAATGSERRRWRQRMYEIEDRKEAINPDDRDAIVAHIRTWRSEIARLRNQQT